MCKNAVMLLVYLIKRKGGAKMYCAYITTLKNLRKHDNADRLQCATIFGNNERKRPVRNKIQAFFYVNNHQIKSLF